MSFENIGGHIIHTSAFSDSLGSTSSTAGIISTSSISTSTDSSQYGSLQSSYHVLGEDIRFSGYSNAISALAISTLNVLGKPFYDELKKNQIYLPKEIEDYLELKFKILERDRKIDDVFQ